MGQPEKGGVFDWGGLRGVVFSGCLKLPENGKRTDCNALRVFVQAFRLLFPAFRQPENGLGPGRQHGFQAAGGGGDLRVVQPAVQIGFALVVGQLHILRGAAEGGGKAFVGI